MLLHKPFNIIKIELNLYNSQTMSTMMNITFNGKEGYVQSSELIKVDNIKIVDGIRYIASAHCFCDQENRKF
jgi:hypothetical protein